MQLWRSRSVAPPAPPGRERDVVSRTAPTRWVAVAVACLALGACESSGSYGERPSARCIPEGACDEAMFELGLVASRGDAARGATLYQATCATCHGPEGRGLQDARRIDMTSPAWHARMRDGEIARVTRAGRPPFMPAFRLSDDQIRDLLAFVRTLKVDVAPAPKTGY